MRLRSVLTLILTMISAPVVSAPLATELSPGDVETISDKPSADELAEAPAPDSASGVEVPPPKEDDRPVANALFAVPRAVILFLLSGPRYAAVEVDELLDKRSPNAMGRDVKSKWRFGGIFAWEKALGFNTGARVGRELAPNATVDGYVGFFGSRGQSGGVRASLGRYTAAELEPALTFDAGRELRRVFAGIGDRGARGTYDQKRIAASGSLTAHAGAFAFGGRAIFDASRAEDPDLPFSEVYEPMSIVGFDEDQRAATGELFVAYDSRRPSYRWVPRSAPSTGFYARAAVGYTRGTMERSGQLSTFRGTFETRRLFDLFHGDRVLSIGGTAEAVSADANELPFDRLPSLGGHERMRAFARDEIRGRTALYGDVQYEWPLGKSARGYLFAETGGASRIHFGYGGGIRLVIETATWLRLQLAGSEAGDIGFYFQFGEL